MNDIKEFTRKDGELGRVLNFRVRSTYAPNKSKMHFCVAWGALAAEIAARGENAEIGIFGTPTTETWTKDGRTQYMNKVVVDGHNKADGCPSELS